jgi:glycosyltransferase involved in cell wall biosynthesis
MTQPMTKPPVSKSPVSKPPVFGFLAVTSGSHEGAIIRDMRLANALHRRGFKVVVYWLLEHNADLIDSGIRQRSVMRSLRYYPARPSALWESIGRLTSLLPLRDRRRFAQRNPQVGTRIFRNLIARMCDGGVDLPVIRRLERALAADGVTHLLPTFAMVCPLVVALKERGRPPFEFLATFQGEEIFAHQARAIGRLDDYYRALRRCVEATPWRAIAVSDDYAARLVDEVGLKPQQLVTIYPGVDLPSRREARPGFDVIAEALPSLRPDVPIVSYFGRQDSEKGVDLLLYAGRMLRERGVRCQLVVSGGSSFGRAYHDICRQIGEHLGLDVAWRDHVSDAVRAALYAHSRCVVYPPIHREPFGMVAPEAMAYGTPVLVPDYGGITETVAVDGKVGGLTFRAWDTRDLAAQLERLITDDALHASLAAAAPTVAEHFGTDAMTDRVLTHMGLPLRA